MKKDGTPYKERTPGKYALYVKVSIINYYITENLILINYI